MRNTTTSSTISTSNAPPPRVDEWLYTPPRPWGTSLLTPIRATPRLFQRYLRKGVCVECKNNCPSRYKKKECPFYEEKTLDVGLSQLPSGQFSGLTLMECPSRLSMEPPKSCNDY